LLVENEVVAAVGELIPIPEPPDCHAQLYAYGATPPEAVTVVVPVV